MKQSLPPFVVIINVIISINIIIIGRNVMLQQYGTLGRFLSDQPYLFSQEKLVNKSTRRVQTLLKLIPVTFRI